MANETHTLRIGIDASLAKRGSQAYVSAVGRIAQATRDFEKMQSQLGKSMSKSGSFTAIARDLQKLNSLRLNPSIAKNVTQLSAALSGFRGPSNASVKNMRNFLRTISTTRVNSALGKNLGSLTAAMSQFRGPSRPAVANTQALLRVLSGARINASVSSQMTAVANAMRGFQGPSGQVVRNIEAMARAISQIRVPRGLGSLSSAMSMLNGRFGTTSAAAIRFGGSVNGIPWGRASQGAIQLTGNLRGLENAMSLSYQMGSQLRALFGALTVSGFTSSVIEATTTSDRLRYLLGAVASEVGEVENQMAFAQDTANKYGLSLLEVQKQFGRFAAAGRSTGLSLDQTQYVFESLASQMRLFGLDAQQQSRAILAITQMFQKGAVQAEEFKTQLGEQLPVFEAMRRAMAKVTGNENVDIMKMMEQGMIGSDAILLMLQEMEQMFGKGIPDALKNPLVGMQNLQNAWTEFLKLVGNAGVMDALGEVSWRLAEIMRTEEFKEMASAIAEGLGNAILKAGDAAAWLLQNVDSVSKVIGALLGMKAVATIGQMGMAFGQLSAMIAGTVTNIGAFAMRLSGLGRFAGVLGAIPLAVGAIGGAFATAAIAAGAGLALMWDKTVKFGDETSSVGAMARVVFSDIGKFASDAATKIGEMFTTLASEASTIGTTISSSVYPILNGVVDTIGMIGQAIGPILTQIMGLAGQLVQTVVSVGQTVATVFGGMFTAFNGDLDTSKMTWRDWSKTIVGFIALVGETMIRVFRTAWRLVIQNTLDAFNIITKSIQGIGAAFNMVGSLATFDTQAAARYASEAGSLFGQVSALADNAAKETAQSLGDLFGGTNESVERYMAGLNWGDEGSTGAQDFVEGWTSQLEKYGADVFQRSMNPEFNPTRPEITQPEYTPPQVPDLENLNPLKNGADGAAGALSSVGKRAKDAADALKDFQAEQAALKSMLDSGKISLEQYNQALDFYKGKLEETVDPYAAMIRSMQEENNILRLNGKEQRLAATYMDKRNELLAKGVVLTDQQTAALQRMIAEQDKLKNPSPLQSWIDGMEDFGDAIESAGVRAMEGLSDSLADLIVDGKADWASLAKSILKDLIKIGLNEVWKGLFGGGQQQMTINAPMGGSAGQDFMNANTPAGNSTVMAGAVAQGIQMAGGLGGGVGNVGTWANDLGNEVAISDVQNLSVGKIDGVGNGPGSFDAFQSMFGARTVDNTYGLPTSSPLTTMPSPNTAVTGFPTTRSALPAPVVTQLNHAATSLSTATTQLNSAADAVQSGYEAFNNGMKNGFGLFGGGGNATGIPGVSTSSPLPVSVETIATTPSAGIPSSAMFGMPAMGNAPHFDDFQASLAGGAASPTGWRSIGDLLAPGKSMSHASGLDPEFARRIEAMFNAPDAPPGLEIFSGYRSVEHQQRLWDEALRKYGSPEAARKWVAPPGRSNHNPDSSGFGRAIDVGQNGSTFSGMTPQAQQWLHQNAGKYGMKFPLSNEGWHMEMQETRGGSPFTGALPGYSQAGMPQTGMMQGQNPMLPMQGYGSQFMQPGMGSMITNTGTSSFSGGLPGGMSIPGAGGGGAMGGAMGMPGVAGGGSISDLGSQFTSQMQGSFTELSQQFPQSMEPGLSQTANLLPQKLTEGEGIGQGLEQAMQPANQMSAQSFQQAYMQANQQVAQNFAMVMQQQMAGMGGGGGGMMGGGGGGIFGGLMGMFMSNGGVVGQSGGSSKKIGSASVWAGARSMKLGGIVGDPEAEPIIAHKGELVTPAHQVDAMRRMGKDAVLLDNPAVDSSRKKMGSGHQDAEVGGSSTGIRSAAPRPIINYNITTPNADSFRASQSQIQAKAGTAAYRDAVRNN